MPTDGFGIWGYSLNFTHNRGSNFFYHVRYGLPFVSLTAADLFRFLKNRSRQKICFRQQPFEPTTQQVWQGRSSAHGEDINIWLISSCFVHQHGAREPLLFFSSRAMSPYVPCSKGPFFGTGKVHLGILKHE